MTFLVYQIGGTFFIIMVSNIGITEEKHDLVACIKSLRNVHSLRPSNMAEQCILKTLTRSVEVE